MELKEFNMELYYLGFNSNKNSFKESDLDDFLNSDFSDVEEWYLNRIK